MTTSVTFNGTTYSIPASGETGWSSLSAFLIDVAGNAQTLAAQKGAIRVAISSPITMSTTDYTVLSNLSIAGAVAVTLPIGVDKTIYVIGDTKGDAQTNNITITPNSGTINGAATYVIGNNFGVVALQYSTAAAEWKVIGRYFTKINAATEVFGILSPANGGTGVANNAASTLTITGSYALGLTLTGITSLTLPTTGTLATTSNKLSAFAATTSAELAGVISDETGSGALVFGTSPTLVTPVLGVATATSINKMAITAPATASTLAVADGKTFTVSNTLTLSGTDGSTAAFGTGGTVAYVANKLSAFAATTSAELAGVISDETGSGALMFGTSPTVTTALLMGAAAETRYYNAGGTFYVGFKGGNAAANKIWTLPLLDGGGNQALSTDGSGTLFWQTVAATTTASPTAQGLVTSYFPTIQSAVSTVSSADATSTTSDGFQTYAFSTSNTGRTLTLPAASANIGRIICIKKTDSGTGTVTVARAGSDTIDGQTSLTLSRQYDSAVIQCISSSLWAVRTNYGKSQIVVSGGGGTGGGFGTTNTTVRLFLTSVESLGSDITYASSAANGSSFTINREGMYSFTYTDLFTAGGPADFGIVKNSAALTTKFNGQTNSLIIAGTKFTNSPPGSTVSATIWCAAGDVIRAFGDTGLTMSVSDALVRFIATRIGN